jgi:hypothetical protein
VVRKTQVNEGFLGLTGTRFRAGGAAGMPDLQTFVVRGDRVPEELTICSN